MCPDCVAGDALARTGRGVVSGWAGAAGLDRTRGARAHGAHMLTGVAGGVALGVAGLRGLRRGARAPWWLRRRGRRGGRRVRAGDHHTGGRRCRGGGRPWGWEARGGKRNGTCIQLTNMYNETLRHRPCARCEECTVGVPHPSPVYCSPVLHDGLSVLDLRHPGGGLVLGEMLLRDWGRASAGAGHGQGVSLTCE